jgi:hypothetical protein
VCSCRGRGANRLGTAVRGGDHAATDGATPTTVGYDEAGGRKAAMPPLGKFNSAWDIHNHASRPPHLLVLAVHSHESPDLGTQEQEFQLQADK